MFIVKREEVAGRWRKIHKWGLHNLYSSYDDKESEEVTEVEKVR
jgi:hypothetical protein